VIIGTDVLERTCKGMIENILFCLSNATKGTIYRIGPMPTLRAVRVTSGIRTPGFDDIEWGLPEVSDYNDPGKSWDQYHDRPDRVKEAMGWCVEKQKSWTADNPDEDVRSVRKQIGGEIEDSHHMEPVLVRKSDLYWDQHNQPEYPVDYENRRIWTDSEYVVVAVIKIHFKPGTIKRGDRSTKIIKKLSRTLGTELLSLHIRETLSEAQDALTRQRLQSCNVLAHEMRNTLVKLGFIFSAINAEIGYLREQWEAQLEKAAPDLACKKAVLNRLSQLIEERLPQLNGVNRSGELARELLDEQQQLARLPLMPHVGDKWVKNRILPKWCWLLSAEPAWEKEEAEIRLLLERLESAVWVGLDKDLAHRIEHLPADLRSAWPRLAYTDFKADNMAVLEEILHFLDHPALEMPHRQQTKKILTSLKALVEMIPELEERANRIIFSLKNGSSLAAPY